MKRKQSYRGIIAVTMVCVVSLVILFGTWTNLEKQKLQLEQQYSSEVEKNLEIMKEYAAYQERNVTRTQTEMQKTNELEAVVAAVGKFDSLSANEAYEVGLSKQYVSKQVSTLVVDLAYKMAAVTSKSDRRMQIENFEEQIKVLKQNFEEATGVKNIGYFQDALAYAKYLKRIF